MRGVRDGQLPGLGYKGSWHDGSRRLRFAMRSTEQALSSTCGACGIDTGSAELPGPWFRPVAGGKHGIAEE